MATYMIKPNGALGYSRVESTNASDDHRAKYEAEGYRDVSEFEFTMAGLLSRYNARRVIREAFKLGREMGEELNGVIE